MPTFFSEHLILSVEAAKANFCRADLLGLPHSLPRGFELFDIVTVTAEFHSDPYNWSEERPV
jgi:hypothetical protein